MSLGSYGNNTTVLTPFPGCMNCTNTSLSQRILFKTIIDVFFGFTLWFCITGCIVSFALFIAMITDKVLRKSSGVLIMNLLLTEFMTNVSIAYNITMAHSDVYPTFAGCKASYFLLQWLLSSGYWGAVFLAINRFVAIVFPPAYRIFGSTFVVLLMTVATWSISGLTPVMFYLDIWGAYRLAPVGGLTACFSMTYVNIAGNPIGEVLGTYIPVGTTGALYALIFIRTALSRWGVFGFVPANHRRLLISRMLFFLYLVHCMCFVPFMVALFHPVIYTYSPPKIFHLLFYGLASTVNPLLMLTLSQDYRQIVIKCFRKVKQWHNRCTGKI